MGFYITSRIRDLGAVADLTRAFVAGPTVDGVGLGDSALNPDGSAAAAVVINGTLSDVDSPLTISNP